MTDKFKHRVQRIDLPEPQRAAHRLLVPGGWLYSWAGGLCFIPTAEEDIRELQVTIDTLMRENREAQAAIKSLRNKAATATPPAGFKVLQYALKEIRSKEGVTLKEAQRIAGNALLEARPDES